MATPPVLDLEALLKPIQEDAPSGEYLKFTGVYDEINLARTEEDADLDQGDWKREVKVADWGKVLRLGRDALESQTKDLQIGGWVAEAAIKQHGFAGLRDGLLLLEGLLEQFWATLFPEIDEGDVEARANILSALDPKLARYLLGVPITNAPGLQFSYLEYEKATGEIRGIRDRESSAYQRALEERDKLNQDFMKAKAVTPLVFFSELKEVTEESLAAFKKLTETIDRLFGRDAPDMPETRTLIDKLVDFSTKVLKEKELQDPVAAAAAAAGEAGPEAAGGGPARSGGGSGYSVAAAIQTRQDALRRLAEIADFFRQTEPHSPVALLVKRAVAWGNMSLEDWLAEVIKDSSVLEGLNETLGIKPKESED